jgi:hypothetical protein
MPACFILCLLLTYVPQQASYWKLHLLPALFGLVSTASGPYKNTLWRARASSRHKPNEAGRLTRHTDKADRPVCFILCQLLTQVPQQASYWKLDLVLPCLVLLALLVATTRIQLEEHRLVAGTKQTRQAGWQGRKNKALGPPCFVLCLLLAQVPQQASYRKLELLPALFGLVSTASGPYKNTLWRARASGRHKTKQAGRLTRQVNKAIRPVCFVLCQLLAQVPQQASY